MWSTTVYKERAQRPKHIRKELAKPTQQLSFIALYVQETEQDSRGKIVNILIKT